MRSKKRKRSANLKIGPLKLSSLRSRNKTKETEQSLQDLWESSTREGQNGGDGGTARGTSQNDGAGEVGKSQI